MDFQFYPTPFELGLRAWRKFKNKNFVRVLEPQAGTGDLAEAGKHMHERYRRDITIDAYEIDASKHPTLRAKGINVVGLDFLTALDGSIYSHMIANPPFAEGAKHVLKAWDILWDGEIVAIINADTLRNPFSGERKLLANLVAEYGDVEYIEGAFAGDDAERRTNVDIALIYLRKKADTKADITGDLYAELRSDQGKAERLAADFQQEQAVALPNSTVENAVLAFDAAVRSMRESTFMEARARHYSAMLGQTMAQRNSGESTDESGSVGWVQGTIGTRYNDLKDRAWASILRSTSVTDHLSSAARRRLESEFEQIKKLEFTVSNIYGFLCGLMEKQGEIQIDMACDVFDHFTRYHSENTVFFKGWKSNDRHRQCGMRLRTTRMILPRHQGYSTSMSHETMTMLQDFDKVWAMLDGKRRPEVGLADIFNTRLGDLRAGERVSSSYFDVRYYPGAGTIHFFARDKHLVDRLNRLVGRHRQWLPPEHEKVSENFWLQYESAEKFDKEFRTELENIARAHRNQFGWMGPLASITGTPDRDDDRRNLAHKIVDKATTKVLERHGISIEFQLESVRPAPLLLEAA